MTAHMRSMKKLLRHPAAEAVLDHADLWAVPVLGLIALVLMVAGGTLTPAWTLLLLPLVLPVLLVTVAVKLRLAARNAAGQEG